jgi:hypothetical protein
MFETVILAKWDPAEIIQYRRRAASRGVSVLQNLLSRLRAAAGRNADLRQFSCLHESLPLIADPTLTRWTSFPSYSTATDTSRNRRITSAFVIMCAVGFRVRNVRGRSALLNARPNS